MIRITGIDKQNLLNQFTQSRLGDKGQELQHTYDKIFSCVPAVLEGDSLVLKTYKDDGNAIMLRMKAKKLGLTVNVEVTVS